MFKLVIALLAILVLIELVQSFYSNEITIVRSLDAKLKEDPTLFRFYQVVCFLTILLLVFGFIRFL